MNLFIDISTLLFFLIEILVTFFQAFLSLKDQFFVDLVALLTPKTNCALYS